MFGVPIVDVLVRILVCVILFLILAWAIPAGLNAIGIGVPELIGRLIAALIAILAFWGWHTGGTWRRTPAA